MIPPLIEIAGAPWRVLPEGKHEADLGAVSTAFAFNAWRRRLFDGLLGASRDLQSAGCQRLYLDGSYVTGKPIPGDYDACWDPEGVNSRLLHPVFRDFSDNRSAQKERYRGEFFPSSAPADRAGATFLEYFQRDRYSEGRKGIVLISLASDPMIPKEVTA